VFSPKQLVRFGIVLATIVAAKPAFSHHSVLAKFDNTKTQTVSGIVELVEWKNPHVHVFINSQTATGFARWAVELESRVDLDRSGWSSETLKPGDVITVQGLAARDGSRQVWANSVTLKSTGKRVLDVIPAAPPVAKQTRPTPRYPDGQPRLGSVPGETVYWAFPSATSLVETGVKVSMDANGLLRNISDAPKVAPFQQWARDLYEFRQRNFLKTGKKRYGNKKKIKIKRGKKGLKNNEEERREKKI